MNMVIQRIFGSSVSRLSSPAKPGNRLSVEQIQDSLRTLLHDCDDARTPRLIYKISLAKTPAELWLLRSDLHQCIAHAHTQTEAAERINGLIDVFEGWLPASQLTRI
ncbi:MAG: hypothetical protein ABI893_09660 [Polaromonas sp.]|uniref:hypothetical protein n=1 Tax=Polaromonas sp. TaxID=1869339 RepID=UPI003264AA8F